MNRCVNICKDLKVTRHINIYEKYDTIAGKHFSYLHVGGRFLRYFPPPARVSKTIGRIMYQYLRKSFDFLCRFSYLDLFSSNALSQAGGGAGGPSIPLELDGPFSALPMWHFLWTT